MVTIPNPVAVTQRAALPVLALGFQHEQPRLCGADRWKRESADAKALLLIVKQLLSFVFSECSV